jgi:hypothetical protein
MVDVGQSDAKQGCDRRAAIGQSNYIYQCLIMYHKSRYLLLESDMLVF